MAFDFKQKLPTPQEIREMYPVPDHVAQIKKGRGNPQNIHRRIR